ncbi:hypothetical protein P692DRAFT_201805410 [Suillus brevipes Sb2]|nr:hypothetical protein P692DRAFT_201805410 [Suillus brevipes Sb2]
MNQTTAQACTLYCVRAGCPVGVVHGVGTDWRTVSCFLDDHARVCKGGPDGLANPPPPPPSTTHLLQRAPRRPRHNPAKRGTRSTKRDKPIAERKERQNDDQRKRDLEEDEYAETFTTRWVQCRGCHHTLKTDKRYNYYPGLWIKHRELCKGIRKMEREKKVAGERELAFQSSLERHPPAAASFDASREESNQWADEEWDGYEYEPPRPIMGFSIIKLATESPKIWD